MTSTSAPAGWYPDPQNPQQTQRYWDGAAWTPQTVPASSFPPAGTSNGQPADGAKAAGGQSPAHQGGDVPAAQGPGYQPLPGYQQTGAQQYGGYGQGQPNGGYGQGQPNGGYPPGTGYPPAAPWGTQGAQQPSASQRAGSLWQRNQLAFITVGVCIVYVLIAYTTRFAFIGILPVLMTIRSFRRREPLAVLALIFTVIAVIVSLVALNR